MGIRCISTYQFPMPFEFFINSNVYEVKYLLYGFAPNNNIEANFKYKMYMIHVQTGKKKIALLPCSVFSHQHY